MQTIINHINRSTHAAHQRARLAAYARLIGEAGKKKEVKSNAGTQKISRTDQMRPAERQH